MYSYIILAGALHLGRDPDGELRAGGHRVQAPAQRPAGQHRPQVSTSTSQSWSYRVMTFFSIFVSTVWNCTDTTRPQDDIILQSFYFYLDLVCPGKKS